MFRDATTNWRTETICFMREIGKVTTAKIMNIPTSYPNKGTACECVCLGDIDCWHWYDFFPDSFSHVALNLPLPGWLYYIYSMIVWYSLLFEIIPFSGDSTSRTGPFCTSPVAYSIVHPLIEGKSASIENQSWFSFACCYELHG